MNPDTWKDNLIESLWEGGINEPDFVEHGLALGMSPEEITEIIDDLRKEDGTL